MAHLLCVRRCDVTDNTVHIPPERRKRAGVRTYHPDCLFSSGFRSGIFEELHIPALHITREDIEREYHNILTIVTSHRITSILYEGDIRNKQ